MGLCKCFHLKDNQIKRTIMGLVLLPSLLYILLQNNSPLWSYFKTRCCHKKFDLVKTVTDGWSYEHVYIWEKLYMYISFINANIRIVYAYVSPGLATALQRRRHFLTLTVNESVKMDNPPTLHRLWLLELLIVLLV